MKHAPRRGRALTVEQLYELASWFPEHLSRLVLLAGQIGARQSFWFSLTDDMLDLDGGTMPIPAELAKNKREHRVYLTAMEVALLREQLMARAPERALRLSELRRVGQWNRARFRDRVWLKSVAAAARTSGQQTGRETSVFDGFTFHWLRHTAGSLMALAGSIRRSRRSGWDTRTAGRCFCGRTGICTRARSAFRRRDSKRSSGRAWTGRGQSPLGKP